MKPLLCAFLIALIAPAPDDSDVARGSHAADESRDAELTSALRDLRAKHDLPALGVGVIRGDGTIERFVDGVRVRGEETPVTVDDPWHLGSCTKAMTALLAAQEVAAGRLSWDSTIAQMLPAFSESAREEYRSITLLELLRHRGGIVSDIGRTPLWGEAWKQEGSAMQQRAAFVAGLLALPPAVERGEYLYANAGYSVVGHAIESLHGQPWEELLRSRVLVACSGSQEWGFGAPGVGGARDDAGAPRVPFGHRDDGSAVAPGRAADNPPAIGPGGTVYGTLSAWLGLAGAFLELARGESALLPPQCAARLFEPDERGGHAYAAGWGVTTRPWAAASVDGGKSAGRVLTHSGSNTMWFAVIWVAPEIDRAFVAVCNQGGDAAAQGTDRAVWAMIERELRAMRPPGSPR